MLQRQRENMAKVNHTGGASLLDSISNCLAVLGLAGQPISMASHVSNRLETEGLGGINFIHPGLKLLALVQQFGPAMAGHDMP